MTLSYLITTAGHARHQNEQNPHDIQTILQLINQGSEEFGDEKVVGFTTLTSEGRWQCDRYSFTELLTLSNGIIAGLLQAGIAPAQHDKNVVSLLCPTGLDFLLGWIALMRMGYGVMFIAPQCSPSAVDHLVTSTSSTHLVYHRKYADLASGTKGINSSTITVELPTPSAAASPKANLKLPNVKADAISHIFHTSGTSGIPKPIPHTHAQSLSVLPRRAIPSYLSTSTSHTGMPSSESAAFTTTPLFHGGVSDLLRAWMARSMIYFYPTSDTPITADNVVGAISPCQSPPTSLGKPKEGLSEIQSVERKRRFNVTSFLSVPYILTVLSEDIDGPAMEMLKGMEFVSTGGAPLDTAVGDKMVSHGVKLVSRLGSSECGFLLTSHRDYDTEKDWEWLRNDSPYSDALKFEPVDEAKYEMVVTKDWSSKTKTNRPDGSYATGDLYEPHTTKKNVWRYAGRGDDVIVMSNGEKASPGPIETVYRSSPIISDALVVGSDKPQLGVLLFPTVGTTSHDINRALPSLLGEANRSSPSFAQISRDMCLLFEGQKTLPKSSKGTVQRGVAYNLFKEEIETLYTEQQGAQTTLAKRSTPQIQKLLKDMILNVTGAEHEAESLDQDTDLFSWGVNSLMATRLRTAIHRTFDTGGKVLPINVVFEKPSISRLAKYIFDLQERTTDDVDLEDDPLHQMESLVQKYKLERPSGRAKPQQCGKTGGNTIVLTGATGSLGSFLLDKLSQLPSDVVERIVCLVRAKDDDVARSRIEESLEQRGLKLDKRVNSYSANFADENLGLNPSTYLRLIETVDVVIHAAWPVHFASSLVSFEDSIKGARNLLDLVASSHSTAQFYFCSSLASVLGQTSERIVEQPSDDPSTASPIGYSRSKWVTEKICRLANDLEGMEGRVHILRVGQLCGDTMDGYWNEKEGWPLLIRTAQTTGCLPLLEEKPSWLPVDLAAQAITEIVTDDCPHRPLVYHVVHPLLVEWDDVLDGLDSAGLQFERVPPVEWLKRIEASDEDLEQNPSRKMLSMWQAAYRKDAVLRPEPLIETTNAQASSATLRDIMPIDSEQIRKMVVAWRRTGFLN
ncbi:hypothetical protein CI109_104455 [Kwoniella shandongensis]|uniref:Uncharacterized protein n=1 Tax=Kwoniella shandongensis TaxID=1734106 RepID=A0A5M6BNS7_9TREE|nr:uncharacterized protein CI109_007305 [Kwoniella shandongensis]KAA5524357.1 hypothetical protein CI109_007305 [Kwoniella shandongensis]